MSQIWKKQQGYDQEVEVQERGEEMHAVFVAFNEKKVGCQ